MIGLDSLRKKVEDEHKKWASINYFVHSPVFKFVYDKASIKDKKRLLVAAMNGEQYYFKKFIKNRKQELEPFQQLSFRKLRDIAKFLRVPKYYSMNKVTLVEEIKNEVRRIKADSQQVINQS